MILDPQTKSKLTFPRRKTVGPSVCTHIEAADALRQ